MKRKKPPQDHTAAAPDSFTALVIGHVRSPYKERFGTPRQPTVTEQTLEDSALDATIELLPGFPPEVWDELVEKGKLKRGRSNTYELNKPT